MSTLWGQVGILDGILRRDWPMSPAAIVDWANVFLSRRGF
jgi:hypothetical protein